MSARYEKYIVAVILVIGFLLRLYASIHVPLIVDEEKEYEIASSISLHPRHLNLPLGNRITEHPFLTQYLVKIGFIIFGENKVAGRFPFVLLGTATLLFIYLLTREGLGQTKAMLAMTLLCLSQFHIGASRISVDDVPMLFFVSVALYVFLRAIRTKDRKLFLLTGPVLGFGYLAIESAPLLLLIFFFFIAISPNRRDWLRTKETYLTIILMFVIIFPSLYWNFNNDFPNFRSHIKQCEVGISPVSLCLFFGEGMITFWDRVTIYQAISYEYPFMHWIMGLICITGVAYSLKKKEKSDSISLLLITFLFIFILFCFIRPRGEGNFLDNHWWPIIAIIPGIILGSDLLVDLKHKYRIGRYIVIGLTVYLASYSCFFVNFPESCCTPQRRFIATMLYYDANNYLKFSDIGKAMDYYQRAIKLGLDYEDLVVAHRNLVAIYSQERWYEKARLKWQNPQNLTH